MAAPLFPQTLSSLARLRIRTSTSSQSFGWRLDLLTCDGGFSISLHRKVDAARTSSRCSGLVAVPREVVEALKGRLETGE